VADLMSAGPNGPCPYLGEPSVTVGDDRKRVGVDGNGIQDVREMTGGERGLN